MPLTDRVIETDKTHQRVEAEKGARGITLANGGDPGAVSPALEREAALALLDDLRSGYPGLHPFMAVADRMGGADARHRVAVAVGAPASIVDTLHRELQDARAAWHQLAAPGEEDARQALDAYAALLAIVARNPNA